MTIIIDEQDAKTWVFDLVFLGEWSEYICIVCVLLSFARFVIAARRRRGGAVLLKYVLS